MSLIGVGTAMAGPTGGGRQTVLWDAYGYARQRVDGKAIVVSGLWTAFY